MIVSGLEDLPESYCRNCGEPIVLDVEWCHWVEDENANRLDREFCYPGNMEPIAEPIEEGLMMVIEEGQV